MAKTISARRHAQAVFELAMEKGEIDKWLADLEVVTAALNDPQLAELLENPKIRFSEKENMLQSIIGGIGPLALNLAKMLVAKNRIGIVDGLFDEYTNMVNAYHGRETAEVTTAVSLSDEEKEKVQGKLVEVTGKELVVTAEVDPEIMGGVVARIGDKLIDGSVRTRLKELRKDLMEAGLEVK
ncbi:ATP synthase F1 subunit delta [Chloroflexota bacterium]